MKFCFCVLLLFNIILIKAQNLPEDIYLKLSRLAASNYDTSVVIGQIDSLLVVSDMTTLDKGKLYNIKGLLRYKFHDMKQAEILYRRAIQLFVIEENIEWETNVCLNLVTLYSDQHQFTKAASELFKVQGLADKNNDIGLKAKVAEYSSHMYYKQGDKSNALKQLELAVSNYESAYDSVALSRLYNNLAVLYKNESKFRKAVTFNYKSLLLSKALDDELVIGNSYNNIAVNYENIFTQTDSLEYIIKALSYYEMSAQIKLKYPNEWNTALENIANIYYRSGKYEKANKYYSQLINNSYNKTQYKKLESLFKQQMLNELSKGHSKKAEHYFLCLDTVQVLMQNAQTKDFQEMLENQKELFETKKKEKEKELKLKDEQHKRLLAETAHNRIKYILLGLIGVVIIVLLIIMQYFKDSKHKNEQEKNILKNKILRNQMNPHFIFNVLTAIQNTLLDNEPLKTSSYIARFSRLIRQNFNFTHKETIGLDEELDALFNYIETQKMRFGDKFKYQIEVMEDVDTAEVKVPPMLLQPIVENAIEHGLKQKKSGGLLQLNVGGVDDKIYFQIIDNGPGYIANKETDGKEHSMDILKARLALPGFGDEKTLLVKKLDDPSGTHVEFMLTYKIDV